MTKRLILAGLTKNTNVFTYPGSPFKIMIIINIFAFKAG